MKYTFEKWLAGGSVRSAKNEASRLDRQGVIKGWIVFFFQFSKAKIAS